MIYLDHAATTPALPEVVEAVNRALGGDFGNPSSVHAHGRRARALVEEAREAVAGAVGCSPAEIVFTGSGTEADNLALKGVARKLRGNGDHLVVSAIEHHAVLEPAEALQREGFQVTTVPVGPSGVVDPADVVAVLRPRTLLVSVMAVNNEIGTLQPITEIARAVKEANPSTLVHTDAVQALANVPVDVRAWGVDLASFSAHKIGGPKGVGALYVRAGVPLEPVIHGGGQERGLRSGTHNVPGIAGFGAAARLTVDELDERRARLARLRDRLWEGLQAAVDDVVLNGDPERRSPNNLNVAFPGADGETLLLLLDAAGVCCSAGSACQSGATDPSHVLLAIGLPKELARASLRFSLGRDTTEADVDRVIEVMPRVVSRARAVA